MPISLKSIVSNYSCRPHEEFSPQMNMGLAARIYLYVQEREENSSRHRRDGQVCARPESQVERNLFRFLAGIPLMPLGRESVERSPRTQSIASWKSDIKKAINLDRKGLPLPPPFKLLPLYKSAFTQCSYSELWFSRKADAAFIKFMKQGSNCKFHMT